jgi:hypothetical protein
MINLELLSQKQIFTTTSNTQSINPGILNSYGIKGNSLNWLPNTNSQPAWIKFNSVTQVNFNSFSYTFTGLVPQYTISLSNDNLNWNVIYTGNVVPTNQNWNIPFRFLKFEIQNNLQSFTLNNFYINVTDENSYEIPWISQNKTILTPRNIQDFNPLFNSIHNSYLNMWETNLQDSILVMDPNYSLNIYYNILNTSIGGIDTKVINGEIIK